MKTWNPKLVPILFALGALLFFVPAVKSVITREPPNAVSLVVAMVCVVLAVVVGRKSDGKPGP